MTSQSRASAWRQDDLRPRHRRAIDQVTQRRPVTSPDGFVALPEPNGRPPYRRALADVVGPEVLQAIDRSGAIRFHICGDTGGHKDPRPQRWVVAAMARELGGPDGVSFFYHLGDVVYPHGEEAHLRPQFVAPYAGYHAPILGVPGNHDAESSPSLRSFVRAFCSPTPPLHDAAAGPVRPAAAQPHVFWTLTHEWVWIIGLWTNVPEGGRLAPDQIDWLVGELRAAPPEATVILAMHQPVYAADVTHGSNLDLAELLDDCYARAGRRADAVASGHVHNYQRFARHVEGRQIPHVVAGAGGYPELHLMGEGIGRLPARFAGLDDVTLEACEENAHGFMTIAAGPDSCSGVYTAVTADAVTVVDGFTIR